MIDGSGVRVQDMDYSMWKTGFREYHWYMEMHSLLLLYLQAHFQPYNLPFNLYSRSHTSTLFLKLKIKDLHSFQFHVPAYSTEGFHSTEFSSAERKLPRISRVPSATLPLCKNKRINLRMFAFATVSICFMLSPDFPLPLEAAWD